MSMTYSDEFREEALRLSDEIGLRKAANQLGLPYYTLSNWRCKRNIERKTGISVMTHKEPETPEERRIRELERENVIKRDFSSKQPITKLLTDISEVQCSDGKLYISPVFDCYNGKIVAIEMRDVRLYIY